MPYEHYNHIEAKPMLIPVPGMEPASVSIQFPERESGPSALQLELLDRIRPEFPRLWAETLSEIQRDWGESNPILYDPIEAFWMVGILISPWEDRRDESELGALIEPTIDNFYWMMFLAPAFPDCAGCYAEYVGIKYLGMTLDW